ncbi:hypothetical protein ACA910_021762 [Epithemia clementina (nom. ined.)]
MPKSGSNVDKTIPPIQFHSSTNCNTSFANGNSAGDDDTTTDMLSSCGSSYSSPDDESEGYWDNAKYNLHPHYQRQNDTELGIATRSTDPCSGLFLPSSDTNTLSHSLHNEDGKPSAVRTSPNIDFVPGDISSLSQMEVLLAELKEKTELLNRTRRELNSVQSMLSQSRRNLKKCQRELTEMTASQNVLAEQYRNNPGFSYLPSEETST